MKFKKIAVLSIFLLVFSNLLCVDIYASDAGVVFGSDEYEHESGEEFPIGVYITGDTVLGTYRIEIGYDADRLEYISGGTDSENGKVIIEGTGASEQESTMLRFRAVSGGNTTLKVLSAEARESDNNELFNITELAEVPLILIGEDLTQRQTETAIESETESSTLGDVSESQKQDSEQSATEADYMPVAIGIVTGLAALLAVILIVIGIRKNKRKKVEKLKRVKNASKAVRSKSKESVVKTDKQQATSLSNKKPVTFTEEKNSTKAPKVFVSQPVFDLKNFTLASSGDSLTLEKTQEGVSKEPVIQVKNVGMTFKVSSSNVSGLKDYMIQKAKGKLKSKKLNALENISFTVYKGEVVGIIGTNGSGKSTLLKIVSGALNPTRGEVIADKSKIQLLTLGTGFDAELSARENVYLNGAIIGYSKDFIDKHYKEIVEFAELEEFMEEKVKNFSSGMVSRLAFSIATVGTVAEILILDEVLSVGDQFFRKKSMERIDKMIHGGATVLIVSHSLYTIREHCTKAIWIEKGVLKQIGNPKDVCAAYSKLHESKGNLES